MPLPSSNLPFPHLFPAPDRKLHTTSLPNEINSEPHLPSHFDLLRPILHRLHTLDSRHQLLNHNRCATVKCFYANSSFNSCLSRRIPKSFLFNHRCKYTCRKLKCPDNSAMTLQPCIDHSLDTPGTPYMYTLCFASEPSLPILPPDPYRIIVQNLIYMQIPNSFHSVVSPSPPHQIAAWSASNLVSSLPASSKSFLAFIRM